MVLVIERKFLEGVWWKYGLAAALAKLGLWVALAYHWDPHVDWGTALRISRMFYLTFAITAFLPFVFGRLQWRRLFWFSLVGFFIAEAAYLFLVLGGFGTRVNLLPFIAYLQLYTSAVGLGALFELGGYVYRKLAE